MELFSLLKTQWRYIKDDKTKFVIFVVLVFCASSFSLVYAYLFGLAVDSLVAGSFKLFVFIYYFMLYMD